VRASLLLLLLVAAVPSGPPAPPALRIPPRSPDAMTGSEFARSIEGLSLRARSRRVLEELRTGNVPDFLRHLVPVRLQHRYSDLSVGRAVVFVSSDYLSIGSDDDYFRIPVSLYTATAFARDFGFVLPTAKMVDAIYAQSEVHVRPSPMKPGKAMRSIDYYRRHNERIERQLASLHLGELVSGHKKDLVLTRKLSPNRKKVAIYGWHKPDGEPIQTVSTIHVGAYADYSHGLRIVSDRVYVNGAERSIYEVLSDERSAKVLSRGGPIPEARLIMGYPAD
jgi:hypothetical protein